MHKLSPVVSQPRTTRFDVAHQLLQYIKKHPSPGQGILFSAMSSLHLQSSANFDWEICPYLIQGNLQLGFGVFIEDSLVSWKPKSIPPYVDALLKLSIVTG